MSRNPIFVLMLLFSLVLVAVTTVVAYYTAQWWLPVGMIVILTVAWRTVL